MSDGYDATREEAREAALQEGLATREGLQAFLDECRAAWQRDLYARAGERDDVRALP